MNKIKILEEINNRKFWTYFLGTAFPVGISENDESLSEILDEIYVLDSEWINALTDYTPNILTSSDGYVEHPNKLEIKLHLNEKLYIEFHPADIIYYINDKKIGYVGTQYQLELIDWTRFEELTEALPDEYKGLLLPVVKIENDNIDNAKKIITNWLQKISFQDEICMNICDIIIDNCRA